MVGDFGKRDFIAGKVSSGMLYSEGGTVGCCCWEDGTVGCCIWKVEQWDVVVEKVEQWVVVVGRWNRGLL